mmetsp:Transcript_31592/g.53455  ORF Transcript_31592/g.53455 Transcript_31592/m.53455 type:complete len:84 (+) Transcript_31592:612-863(+)
MRGVVYAEADGDEEEYCNNKIDLDTPEVCQTKHVEHSCTYGHHHGEYDLVPWRKNTALAAASAAGGVAERQREDRVIGSEMCL